MSGFSSQELAFMLSTIPASVTKKATRFYCRLAPEHDHIMVGSF